MNKEQYKKFLPILIWWIEGKELQLQYLDGKWENYRSALSPSDHFDNPDKIEWRIKPEVKEGWINIYPQNSTTCEGRIGYVGDIHSTKEDALRLHSRNRIACIKISYTEGDGL